MHIPVVYDNQTHKLADVLNSILAEHANHGQNSPRLCLWVPIYAPERRDFGSFPKLPASLSLGAIWLGQDG
jgi:hypothetical protein